MASMPPVYNRAPADSWAEFRLGKPAQPGEYTPQAKPQDVSAPMFQPPAVGNVPLPGAPGAEGGSAPEVPAQSGDAGQVAPPLKLEKVTSGPLAGLFIPPLPESTPAPRQPAAGMQSNPSEKPRGAITPEMIGDLPKGTAIEFGPGGGGSWNRNDALWDIHHITRNQEATIVAFWNANFKNPDLTSEAVRAFFEQQHIPLPVDIDAAVEEAKTGMRNGKPFSSYTDYDLSGEEKAFHDRLDAELARRGGASPESAIRAGGNHLAQGAVMGAGDELSGVQGAVNALMHLENPITAYQWERDLVRRDLERGSQAHPYISLGAEIAGSLLTGKFGMGRVETVSDAIKAGSKIGAVTEFNNGEGLFDSVERAGRGTVTGGLFGGGTHKIAPLVGKVGRRFLPKGITEEEAAANNVFGEKVIAAGERIDVPTRPAEYNPRLRDEGLAARDAGRGARIFERTDAADDRAMRDALHVKIGGGTQAVGDGALGNTMRRALDRVPQSGREALPELFDASGSLRGGADIVGTIKGWAQTDEDFGKLQQIFRVLAPAEKAELRANIAAGLGQDASGAFSAAQFLKTVVGDAYTKPLLTPKARQLILGRRGAAALRDLRLIATQKLAARGRDAAAAAPGIWRDGAKAGGIGMRTAVFTTLGGAVGTIFGGVPGGAAGSIIGAGADVMLKKLGERRMAELLTNPDVTGWLRRMPEATDPKAIDRYFQVLTTKVANTAAAQDVEIFHQALIDAFSRPRPPAADGTGPNSPPMAIPPM